MGIRAAESHDVLSTIIRNKAVTIEDVLVLRRQVWPDGEVSKSEAEMLFRIDEAVEQGCAEWTDFFVEAISAHLIDQAHPQGYVSDADAAWLEQRILADDAVKGATELETLVRVLERATHVPHRLEMAALKAVVFAVMEGDGEIVANGTLQKGIIGDPEVALLRRVLYAKAGARSDAISLDEAEAIFDLNDATAGQPSCPAWTTLFVNVISNYLLMQSGYEPPSRERLKEVDAWLNRPSSGVIGFAAAVAKRKGKELDPESRGFFGDLKAMFTGDSPMENHYKRRNAANEAARVAAEKVDSDEARWLVDRIRRSSNLTENEQALLTFLKAGEYEVDASLQRLIDEAA